MKAALTVSFKKSSSQKKTTAAIAIAPIVKASSILLSLVVADGKDHRSFFALASVNQPDLFELRIIASSQSSTPSLR